MPLWDEPQQTYTEISEITKQIYDVTADFESHYGYFDKANASWTLNNSLILRLIEEMPISSLPTNLLPTSLLDAGTLWGIPFKVDDRLDEYTNALRCGDDVYHFHIATITPPSSEQEKRQSQLNDNIIKMLSNIVDFSGDVASHIATITPPPRPDKNTAPYYDCDPSIFDGIIRIVTRIIDWLNKLAGATEHKPKRKQPGEQMATLGELFEGYEEVESCKRPRPSKTPYTRF